MTAERRRRWGLIASLIAALLIGTFLGAAVTSNGTTPRAAETEASAASGTAGTPLAREVDDIGRLTFAPIIKKALASVVNVSAAKVVRSEGLPAPFFDSPLFREFFDPRGRFFDGPRERRSQSLGSGVIVRPNGYVLTNNHVVDGAEEIEVQLQDGRSFQAEVVGTDPPTDLAVLKVDASELPAMELGHSASVEVGDLAFAIGNPFGVGQTVTMGIVSAVGRGNLGIVDYENFIQTDASINPGNSGGALIDATGALIGINTAIVSRGAQGNQGVGFAIPIDLARDVMEQILTGGHVVRGWLGVTIQEVTPELAKSFDLDEARGALVGEVTPGSPAAEAGIEPGDVIVRIDDAPVENVRSLRLAVAGRSPESTVKLTLVREGRERTLSVTLGELPDELQPPSSESGTSSFLEDVQVRELTPPLRRQLGLEEDVEGVLVAHVGPGGSAEEAGLRRGDVIVSVNRRPVHSVEALRSVVAGADGDLLLLVHRRGAKLFLVVEKEDDPR